MDIIQNLDVKDNTKVNYMYKFKKIQELGINYKSDERFIIDRFMNMKVGYNTTNSYLNIVIVLRKAENLPIDLLLDYRADRYDEELFRETDTNKKNKILGYPSLNTLLEYTNILYETGKYKEYIINYLLLNTNCRNKDLDLTISYSEENEDENYLVIDNGYITFIRNDYKTKETYGKKVIKLTENKLIESCKKLGTGKLLKNTNKNQEIRNATYMNMGQGRYFKAIAANSSIQDLKILSKNRGTNVGTIVNYYS